MAKSDGLGGVRLSVYGEVAEGRVVRLTSQMRRCAVSIASNIAEGQGRNSKGEFYQFLGNARGSIEELRTQVLIVRRLRFVLDPEVERILEQVERVARLVNGLMQAVKPKTLRATAGG